MQRLLRHKHLPLYLLPLFYGLAGCFFLWRGSVTAQATLWLLPVAMLAGYFLFFRQRVFAFAIMFLLPLSINLRQTGFGFGISLPAEPMIALLGMAFLAGLAIRGRYPKEILSHPMSLLLFAHLGWNVITTLTSAMPLISLKFVAIRTLFILVFYFYFILLFREAKNIGQFFGAYIAALLIVTGYTFFNILRARSFWDMYFVSEPFFADHTIFGACVAFVLPLTALVVANPSVFRIGANGRLWALAALPVLIAGLIFSYSRAAWMSVAAAAGFYILLRLRVRLRTLMLGGALAACVLLLFTNQLTDHFSRTRAISDQSLLTHAASVTNVKSDVSNTERINRWNSAIRMFEARPYLGFGPGTYQFQYNPFQAASEMTWISTRHGDKGESHSEYLKPLSESGLPGLLSHVAIVLGAIFYGMRLAYNASDKRTRLLATGILLGLITYFVHGFVNFFLDTDKVSALYWGMIAMLVALDVQERRKGMAMQGVEAE